MRIIIVLLGLFFSFSSLANWQLNNQQSRLSFISIKKTNIAEVHLFTQLKGSLDHQAKIKLIIDLSSVNTHIAKRDQRIQKYLFETNIFPQAIFSAQLNQQKLSAIKLGESAVMTIHGSLDLHGVKQTLTTSVLVARLSQQKFIVSSMQPIILQAGNYHLSAGVEKLQALAKLPSVSKAVPVSFVLTFVKK